MPMTRHWSRAIFSLGMLTAALVPACGGDSSDTVAPPGEDAGRKDSSASGGDNSKDSGSVGDDATIGDAAGDDATGGDATGGADDASDAGRASGDASGDSGGDGAGLTDAPAGGNVEGGGDGGVEAGATPVDGGHDGGDSGGSTPGNDAGPDGSARDGGAAPDGSTCNFAGTWAAEITMDVSWAAGGLADIVIAPGSGTIKQWILSTRTQSGTIVTDTAVACGIQLPDFQGNALLVNETWGIRFPNDLFDSGNLASFSMNGTVSGSTPTATYTTTPAAVLLGLTLPNAATAVWPSTITTEVDEDKDRKPGITANVAPPGGGFSYVPLDISVTFAPTTVPRADHLYVAIRQVTSVNAQFTDCDHASGSVTVPQITDPSNPNTATNKKYAIDSHVIGCSVTGSATDCSANQTTFVDGNQPVFVPSATTFTSVRLASGATCATVRSAFP
jgi:hypothetical protein